MDLLSWFKCREGAMLVNVMFLIYEYKTFLTDFFLVKR